MAELFEAPIEIEKTETPVWDLIITASVLIVLLLFAFWYGQLFGQTETSIISLAYAVALVFSLAILFAHYLGAPFVGWFGIDKSGVWLFGLAAFGSFVGFLLTLPGRAFFGNVGTLIRGGAIDTAVGFAVNNFVAPVGETIIFHGAAMPTMEEVFVALGLPRWVAAILADLISSFLLTLAHLVSRGGSIDALLPLWVVFSIFGAITRLTRSILAELFAHFDWNLITLG